MSLTRRQSLFALAAPVLLSACGGSESSDGIDWTEVRRAGAAGSLNSICYGNSTYVAAEGPPAQAVSYSADGKTWTAVPVPVTGGFGSVIAAAFGNGRFVAISNKGDIYASVDGQTWDVVASNASTAFDALTFGNGRFLVTGTSGDSSAAMIWQSVDGLTWPAPVSSDLGEVLTPTRFVNGNLFSFPLSSAGRTLWESTDSGATWSQAYIQVNGKTVDISDMTYGNGLYVAATDDGDILSSTDGVNWTVRQRFDATNYTCLSFLGNTFVLTNGRSILSSSNGLSWDATRIGQRDDILDSVAFDGRQFVVVGYPGLVILGPVV